MLKLKNIKKSFKTGDFIQQALKGINLSFREKEFVAILGSSGSGKTTLLNIIGGLDHYDSGDLVIKGKSTKKGATQEENSQEATPKLNFVISSYYKGTGLEEVLKKLEEYLDNANPTESDITNI